MATGIPDHLLPIKHTLLNNLNLPNLLPSTEIPQKLSNPSNVMLEKLRVDHLDQLMAWMPDETHNLFRIEVRISFKFFSDYSAKFFFVCLVELH